MQLFVLRIFSYIFSANFQLLTTFLFPSKQNYVLLILHFKKRAKTSRFSRVS